MTQEQINKWVDELNRVAHEVEGELNPKELQRIEQGELYTWGNPLFCLICRIISEGGGDEYGKRV